MDACTIIAKNYLAYARVLARSFAEHHPDGRFSVLIIDEFDGYIESRSEPFEILTPEDIGCPEFALMSARYNVLELSTAVKPWLLRYLLARGTGAITYLDPDIQVFAPLTHLDELGRDRGLVLIPHNTVPIPFDGQRPSQVDIMIAGVFNLGYISLGTHRRTEWLLDWWSERLLRDCRVDPVWGYFVDQRWMDLIPGFMPDVVIVREPEYNVAYWNLHGRDVQRSESRYLVDGRSLGFFHFSGFDPNQPDALSRFQTRTMLAEQPVLSELCQDYADSLIRNGHDVAQQWEYSFGHLPDGTPFTTQLRQLFREGEQRGELHQTPFSEAGSEAFVKWLCDQEDGGPPGVSRLFAWYYRHRVDLPTVFADIYGADRLPYLEWASRTGIADLGLPARFAPRLLAPMSSATPREFAHESPQEATTPDQPEPGVNVVGYFRSELGVGEAARQVVNALDTVGVPVLPLHGRTIPPNRQGHQFTHLGPADARYPLNLICMNADVLPAFAREVGYSFFKGRYSVGLWFWEVSTPPVGNWMDAFALVDEVWAPSHHVARTISSVAPIPTVRIPLPIELPPFAPRSRRALGLPEGEFVFLYSFDYHSVFERKNPLALVEAFRTAFEPGSGAALAVKAINAESDPDNRARLHEAAAEHEDIYLLEGYFSPSAKNALVAASDCYVSLHRAEGFGLTMGEAMFLEKPVIATGYSGNMDFMTPWNSYLIDYELVAIGPGVAPYPAEGEWAEPSVGHASRLMREVFEDRAGARERGRRGAADIRQSHGSAPSGEQMRRRLTRCAARESDTGSVVNGVDTRASDALAGRLARGPMSVRARNLPRKVIRRAVFRALKPFTSYQLPVNAEILSALREVENNVTSTRSDLIRSDAERLRQARGDSEQWTRLTSEIDWLRTEIDQLRFGLSELRNYHPDIVERLDNVGSRLAVLEADLRAIPYMAAAEFDTGSHPVAGKVLGYVNENGAGQHGYRSFEDVFRGSEEFIRERQHRYLEILDGRQPVLDLGCGRGEFLDVLRDAGLAYDGIDLDKDMVRRCREKGHARVVEGDGLDYLASLPNGSLGAIFTAQVIEHLSEDQLRELLASARAKLDDGGVLIAETVNPHSPAALKNFWVDLTHRSPIFPEVALELCREAGFPSAYVFHPQGEGDFERDRFTQGEYAVVASAGDPRRSGDVRQSRGERRLA